MNLFKISLPATSAGRFERSGYSESLGGDEGFIFSLFGENMPLHMIPYDPAMPPLTDTETDAICRANDSSVEWPEPISVSRDEHIVLVQSIVDHLKATDCGEETKAKIIAARVSVVETRKTPAAIYRSLRDAYPDATVFLFSTPYTGTWIGASPELLLGMTQERLLTVALAGTREASSHPSSEAARPWDRKNRREQQIVTDFITDLLRGHGYKPITEGPFTRQAGKVEHICTEISALVQNSSSGSSTDGTTVSSDSSSLIAGWTSGTSSSLAERATELIMEFSPTPALSGYPRHEAIEYISTHESNPRHCYGGAIGYMDSGRVSAYVNLRSGRLLGHKSRIALYAGGGITRDSDPASEWDETTRKLTTLLPHL